MSRIGNIPIKLPDGVSLKVDGKGLLAKGPKGELRSLLPEGIELKEEASIVHLTRKNDEPQIRALHGTTQVLLKNNIHGVSQGWDRSLELMGVGYRAQLKGKELVLSLGYSHEIRYPLPEGVDAKVTDQTKIALSCIDKQKLGQVASEIRNLRPPEPYKGKGIRYTGEHIIRKSSKSGKK